MQTSILLLPSLLAIKFILKIVNSYTRSYHYSTVANVNHEVGPPVPSTPDKLTPLILYGFLALVLACHAQRDVVAIAIYLLETQAQVYYTQNEFLDGDDEY